jgi:hypothetical protein
MEVFAMEFKDGQICQICQVVLDIEKTMKRLYEDFGFGPWDVYEYGPHNVRDSMYRGKPNTQRFALAVTWRENLQYELIQPLDGYSVYNEFIEKHGEGLQHIKLYYENCTKVLEQYKQKGYEIIQSGKIGDDEFYYLESADKIGITLELGNAGIIPPPLYRYPKE